MRRLTHIGDALSQLGNVTLLPRPDDTNANESISGRSYREGWKVAQWMINALFFWQNDHCKQAYLKDVERAKALIQKHEQGAPWT